MANPELGAKQICPTCSSKFYDLGRRPAACPKCGETFDPEEALRNRRVRARSSTPDYEDEPEKEVKAVDPDADGFEEEPDQTPEIDDEAAVEAIETDDEDADAEGAAPAPGADDLGVDFAEDEDLADDADEDVPFLEDEDDDDFPEDEIDGLPGEDDADDR
ncbi:MAG TPA: TIGR02300 family protein [Caulobacter sp.]|nr:TIGR02300 family protein [Caulobacter sp.]